MSRGRLEKQTEAATRQIMNGGWLKDTRQDRIGLVNDFSLGCIPSLGYAICRIRRDKRCPALCRIRFRRCFR